MSTGSLPEDIRTPFPPADEPALDGLLVEVESPGALLTAAEHVRDAGYTRWDTHTPFPVHGIDEAMGIRPTRLPWLIFAFGVFGCGAGLFLQWWTNATGTTMFPNVPTFLQGYDFPISGKPTFSLPANIPIIFEMTVLFAALAAVFGMLASNNLPQHHQPKFAIPRFRRATADGFFIYISARDPKFDPAQTRALLASVGSSPVEEVHEASSSRRLPRGMTVGFVIAICLAFLPPLLVAYARTSYSPNPRIHLIQDMDNQERYDAQQVNPLFLDGRADRPQVPGTVSRVDWPVDAPYDMGRPAGWHPGDDPNAFITDYPPRVEVTVPLVQRGRERFNVYCTPCHGIDGYGNGMVNQRALALDTPGWVPPASMHDELVRGRPLGHLFDTITHGRRTMPPYGDQIPVADRWAIIAYIQALELSQAASIEAVPPERRSLLR